MPIPAILAALVNLARTGLTIIIEKAIAYATRTIIGNLIGRALASFKPDSPDGLTFDSSSSIMEIQSEEEDEILDFIDEGDEEFEFSLTEDEEELSIEDPPQPLESFRLLPETVEEFEEQGLEIEVPNTSSQLPDFQFTEDE